jgi:hypothetical protein
MRQVTGIRKFVLGAGCWVLGGMAVIKLTRLLNIARLKIIILMYVLFGLLIQGNAQSPQVFTTPGTINFTIPAGVTCVQVEVWGGGGKGSTSTNNGGGGGGGGGAYSRKVITVIPGNIYSGVVGIGSSTTSAGGDSYFINTTTILAKGGNSLGGNITNGALGGLAANGFGDIRYSGGNGANGLTGNYGGGGGSSAGNSASGNNGITSNGGIAPVGGGSGGNGKINPQGDGSPGIAPGGGGGGSLRTSNAVATRLGGKGGDGQVVISWGTLASTVTPVVNSPVCYGSTSVTGTSAEVNGTVVTVYLNGISIGTSIVSGNVWTLTGIPQLTSGTITATAKAIDKCMSGISAGVVVSSQIDAGTLTPLAIGGGRCGYIIDGSPVTSCSSPIYSWYFRRPQDKFWTLVPGETGEDLVPPGDAGTNKLKYQRIVYCGSCKDSADMNRPLGPFMLVAISSTTNVTCFGLQNGTATGSVTIGYTPIDPLQFTFIWTNSTTGQTITSNPITYPANTVTVPCLAPGTYTLRVRDNSTSHCSADSPPFTITQPGLVCPPPLTFNCASQVPVAATTYAEFIAAGAPSCTSPPACASPTITSSDVISNQTCPNRYTLTRTYTATDIAGTQSYTSSCSQTITVNDNTAYILPANGNSTVNCVSDAVVPTIPTVTVCGSSIIPVLQGGAPETSVTNGCGTVIYTYSYFDCLAVPHNWTYTYTVTPTDFTLPAAGASTVNCVGLATAPTTPDVTRCGVTIIPVLQGGAPVSTVTNGCGTVTYTYIYTDCAAHTHNWTYTYTVTHTTAPAEVGGPVVTTGTAQCFADVVAPTLPVVNDICNNIIPAPTPVISGTASSHSNCYGTVIYTYIYTDCANLTFTWVYTYTISAPVVTLPAGGASTVACLSAATLPTPPTVLDNCGRTLTVSAGVAGTDPVCAGTKTWTFTYTDCAGATYPWVYTYTISAPVVTMTCPPAQTFCEVSGNNYTIPKLVASVNCSGTLTITFQITGTTIRNGIGDDASGILNTGISTIKWTVDDSCGNLSTCTTEVTINPLPTTSLIYHR